MARTLGFKISPRGQPEYADIHSTKIRTRVEVKARGDNNPHGLHVDQVNQYEWDLPEELRHTLYALVPYRSRRSITEEEQRKHKFSEKTTMISMLRFLKTDRERNRYWAKNVDVIYLIDLRIVNGLQEHLGTIRGHFAGRPNEETIVVGRNKLTELFQDDALSRSLRKLGLHPSGWAKGVYPLKVGFTYKFPKVPSFFEDVTMEKQWVTSDFTLITVVRRELHAILAEQIMRRTPALV